MTTNATLTDFLLARIAEDEAAAPSEHYAPFEREWEWCPAALTEPVGDILPGPCECNLPARRARVLAECEAKRRIVLSLGDMLRAYDALPGDVEDTDPVRFEAVTGAANLAESVLRELATTYADHPDYRQEWKP